MHDDDIKKLLTELKTDDFEEVRQPIYQKRSMSSARILFILICLTLAPSAYMLINAVPDDEEEETVVVQTPPAPTREQLAASWAKEIVELDPDEGESIHLLWDMLRRRKEDLEGITLELSRLLTDNARFRQDYYEQAANALLLRYQALDARHSVEISNQVNTIYREVQRDPELTIAYAEMLGELGAQSYSTHQIQIARDILQQESVCQKALSSIDTSRNLSDLEYNVGFAGHVIQETQENPAMQTFYSDSEYELTLVQKSKEVLDKLLAQETFTDETRKLVKKILLQAGAPESDISYYLDKFKTIELNSQEAYTFSR